MKIVQRSKARVPERTSLHSFNLLWLMWAVCGGFFITNFILAVWLELLVKPVYEEPVDTAQVQKRLYDCYDFHIFHIIIKFRMCMIEILQSIV